MTELSKEHFDNALKAHFDKVFTTLATKEDLRSLDQRVDRVERILEMHSATLDAIAKGVIDWNTEIAALRNAVGRHEELFRAIAQKLGFNLDELLKNMPQK